MAFAIPFGKSRVFWLTSVSEGGLSTGLCSRAVKRRQVSVLIRHGEVQRQPAVAGFSLGSLKLRKEKTISDSWNFASLSDGSGGSGGRHGSFRRKYGPEGGDHEAAGDQDLFSIAGVFSMRRRTSDTRVQKTVTVSDTLAEVFHDVRISHILMAVNVVIFAFQALYGPGMLMSGAKVNSAIAAGQYYRLLSPMFLHASSSHLLVNSFSLHSTGPSVESWFGKVRFLCLYLTSGISGNVLSYLCSPAPAVGASGAIFGLVGASVVILGRHRRMLGSRARKGLQSLAYIVLMNFGMGLAPGSRVDNFGHLGGFLGGIAFSYLLGPRLVARRTRTGRAVLRDEPILNLALVEMRGRLNAFREYLKTR